MRAELLPLEHGADTQAQTSPRVTELLEFETDNFRMDTFTTDKFTRVMGDEKSVSWVL